jgi:predicted DNA-binding transcriptional regulator AlpA
MAPKRAVVAADCCATEPPDKPRRKTAFDENRTKYLSLSDFARFGGMSRSTAWRLAKSGRLRVFRLGPRLLRVPTSEIARLGRVKSSQRNED